MHFFKPRSLRFESSITLGFLVPIFGSLLQVLTTELLLYAYTDGTYSKAAVLTMSMHWSKEREREKER